MGDDSLLSKIRLYFDALASGVRFGQFISVGITGALVETVLITILTGPASVALLPAKLVSTEISILLMFFINDRWTFSRQGKTELVSLLKRILKSNFIRIGGVAVATTVLLVLSKQFGLLVPVANIIGIGAGFLVNFVFESLVTWRVHER